MLRWIPLHSNLCKEQTMSSKTEEDPAKLCLLSIMNESSGWDVGESLSCTLFIFFIVKVVTLLLSKHNKETKTRILIQQPRNCSTIRVQFYEHHLTSKVQQENLNLQVVRAADWDALYSWAVSKHKRVAQISTHSQSNSELYFLLRVTPSTEQGKVIFYVWATCFSAWVLNHKITWLNGELNQYKLLHLNL